MTRIGVITFPGTLRRPRRAARGRARAAARPSRSGTPTPTSTAARGVIVPGGFSYGDYLRAGAIARFAPMMREVEAFAAAGGPVLGICNGFQVLCEAGLLPGVLRPNHHGRFVCRDVDLVVAARRLAVARGPRAAATCCAIPVKHHDGAWYAPPPRTTSASRPRGQVALRYAREPERRARRRRLRHERGRQRLRPDAASRARDGRAARAGRRTPAAAGPGRARDGSRARPSPPRGCPRRAFRSGSRSRAERSARAAARRPRARPASGRAGGPRCRRARRR